MTKNAIIISASSDIGAALTVHWASLGWKVCGTFRTRSPMVDELEQSPNVRLFYCDLLDSASIEAALVKIINAFQSWDILVFAPGILSPVGPFSHVSFQEWEEGIQVNFLRPLGLLHRLLPHRNKSQGETSSVLFFAGGGANNAVRDYSCYTVSKIALIKMVELLDAEIHDTRFVILGPGWVKTKIHQQSLQAVLAPESAEKTKEKIRSNNFTPMSHVLECCHWLVTTQSPGVKGRNFSVVHDPWGTKELESELEKDFDMFKLRRSRNEKKG